MGVGDRTWVQTVAFPRGQVAIAAGHETSEATMLKLKATCGETEYGIAKGCCLPMWRPKRSCSAVSH